MTFLVCGEALFDLFAEETEAGFALDARIGGSPFNVAVGLARLGAGAALLTGLSRDLLGRRLRRAVEAEGVSARWLAEKDGPTTLGFVSLGAEGGAEYAFYGAGAADRRVALADLPPQDAALAGAHAGSYSLVVEPTASSLLTLFRRRRGRGLSTLDPNLRLNVEPDLDLWRQRVDAFVGEADLVKVSDEDLALLSPDRSHDQVAEDWLSRGAALVIVTRGARGAAAWGGFGRVETPGRAVAVVDTVGAGDSFQAATIAALLAARRAERPALEALGAEAAQSLLDWASGAAALTCARRGADLPRREALPPPPALA